MSKQQVKAKAKEVEQVNNKPDEATLKLQELNGISLKEYNEMPIDQKRSVLELVIFANNYYKERTDKAKADKKILQATSKLLTESIKANNEITKELSTKFGKIENPTKKDFVINQYLNWNQPQRVISLAVEIWDFCAQSTLTTINAIQGSKPSNKKFDEFKTEWAMVEANSSKGKVFKIDLDKLPKEKAESINYFSLADFKAEALRQSLRVTKIETNGEKEEVDESLDTVDIDF